jgi:hypothetical protein
MTLRPFAVPDDDERRSIISDVPFSSSCWQRTNPHGLLWRYTRFNGYGGALYST